MAVQTERKYVQIQLDEETLKKVDELAKKEDRLRKNMIEKIIKDSFN